MTGAFDVPEVAQNECHEPDLVADLARSLAAVIRDLSDRVAALEARTAPCKPLAECSEAELRAFITAEFARPPAEPI